MKGIKPVQAVKRRQLETIDRDHSLTQKLENRRPTFAAALIVLQGLKGDQSLSGDPTSASQLTNLPMIQLYILWPIWGLADGRIAEVGELIRC